MSLHNFNIRAACNITCLLLFVYSRLPEIPPDTPETNPVMRINEYPQYSKITPEQTVTGCAKLAIEFDVHFGKHVENLKGDCGIYCFSLSIFACFCFCSDYIIDLAAQALKQRIIEYQIHYSSTIRYSNIQIFQYSPNAPLHAKYVIMYGVYTTVQLHICDRWNISENIWQCSWSHRACLGATKLCLANSEKSSLCPCHWWVQECFPAGKKFIFLWFKDNVWILLP